MQTKKRLSMIQSPRGQINVTAPIGFPIETVETYMNPDQNITSTRKITPSEIHFTLGDKTTKYIRTRKNIARKSLARKTKEPRHTLAPQWNIIEDGTITGYSPHTITLDTPLRKNTVIRKMI